MIRKGLNRAAPEGMTDVTVAAGYLAGMRLSLDMKTEKDFWLGTYEPDLQSAIVDLVKPGMVAYDVGANIGYFSLLLARMVGSSGKVFAFEALPANVQRLKNNVSLNDLGDIVTVVPAAIVDRNQPVDFLLGPSTSTGKVKGPFGRHFAESQEVTTVEGIGLDEYTYSQTHMEPSIIKMDIEGGEVLAFPGMRRVLRQARPLMFVELHGEEAAQTAWDELTGAGYHIASMTNGYPEVSSLLELDWKAYIVAFPKD
jgi:FkbM family methyltransferase